LRVISYQTTMAKEQEYVRYCYKRFFKWDFEAHGVFCSSEFSRSDTVAGVLLHLGNMDQDWPIVILSSIGSNKEKLGANKEKQNKLA